MQGHTHRSQLLRAGAEFAVSNPFAQMLENDVCQELGCCIATGEGRFLIEVAVVELGQHGAEGLARHTDVDNDTIVIKVLPSQLQVHNVGRAVKVLSEAKHLALKAVRKHDLVANTDDIHKGSFTRRLQPAQPLVKDTMTESTAGVRCEFSHHCRQLIKM